MTQATESIELSGHIIDSMILPKVMSKIMNHGGRYKFVKFEVGKNPEDVSRVRLQVIGNDSEHLTAILNDIHTEGVTRVTPDDIVTRKAPKDMALPTDFYSTTNNETLLFHNGSWITAQNQMMDKCVVVKEDAAWCTPIRDVRKGDDILCGENGIRVIPPARPRKTANIFAFMGGSSSSERPTQHIAKQVATDIFRTKMRHGRIILVGGPAIVHTGASPSIASMIRDGYLDGVLAGNALAVHDIENSLYGTSLGMHVKDASLASKGYRHHMDTVNTVFTHGSIPNMVKTGTLRRGIFYECVKHDVPYVLAGSIRDDGPLPDVITDVVEAQRQYKKIIKGADMVLMVATMLHSIATGNMLPSNVRIVAVDINQSTVTKLMDRGTWQALGIVTDVGAFLPLVEQELGDLEATRP